MKTNEKDGSTDKMAKVFDIKTKANQVLSDASWKLKKQTEEMINRNKKIMQEHTILMQEMQDLLLDIWDEIDPIDEEN
jgi:hypothetical protein